MNSWQSESSPIGWIVVYATPQGQVWFYPDTFGNVRSIFSSLIGVTFDLQQLARIGNTVKRQFPVPRFGHRGSGLRGEFCKQLCAALNEAKLFPARKVA